jgi:hypothetical protein
MLCLMVMLLLIANTINVAADLAAMGTDPTLARRSTLLLCLGARPLVARARSDRDYERHAHILKWFTSALFAYVATAFVAHVDWSPAAYHFSCPRFNGTRVISWP